MKKIAFLGLVSFILAACHIEVDMSKVPKDAILCHSDWDCPSNSYCGFAEMDTPAVCRN